MKKLFFSIIVVMMFILAGCSCGKSETQNVVESDTTAEKQNYMLYLDLESENNLMFSQYDLEVRLDGTELGTIANGEKFSKLVSVQEGSHELKICEAGDSNNKAVKSISVSGDMTFSCEIAHAKNNIELKNIRTVDGVVGASIEVADVTGMVLREAKELLTQYGFANVSTESDKSIWDEDNWIVTSQNVAPGTKADKNVSFVLSCSKLNEYFSEQYVGKTIAEVRELAASAGFSLTFMDEHGYAIDGNSLEPDSVVTYASQYGGAEKTAVISVNNIDVEEIIEPIQTDNPAPVVVDEEIHYSTNDSETIRNGNSGVYAYVKRGPEYNNYLIIDFDNGFVYSTNDAIDDCERVHMESGTLKDELKYTYHNSDGSWSEFLYFKNSEDPTILIHRGNDKFEDEYYPIDLDQTLIMRDSKSIVDY